MYSLYMYDVHVVYICMSCEASSVHTCVLYYMCGHMYMYVKLHVLRYSITWHT